MIPSICNTLTSTQCSAITTLSSLQTISQRDATRNQTILDVVYVGLDLNLADIRIAEAVLLGFKSLWLDLYWDEESLTWDGIDTLTTISDIVSSTGSRFAANVLHLFVRLHSKNLSESTISNRGRQVSRNKRLSTIISDTFGTAVYTPEDLEKDRKNGKTYSQSSAIPDSVSGFPLVSHFLEDLNKRVLITASNASLSWQSSYSTETLQEDTGSLFLINYGTRPFSDSLSTKSLDANISQISNNSQGPSCLRTRVIPPPHPNHFDIVLDSEDDVFTTSSIADYIACGEVPMIKYSVEKNISELVPLANSAIWSWEPSQPNTTVNDNRCAVMDQDGWRVANCSEKHPTLCSYVIPEDDSISVSRKRELLYSFKFGDVSTYHDAVNSCPSESEGLSMKFGLPASAVEDTSVHFTIENSTEVDYPVWIDFNSIAVRDCWVAGGPNAKCPYDPRDWSRNKVALLTVAVTISFFVIVMIFFLNWQQLPVRQNEKKWKKIVKKFRDHQYEGVPA